MRAHQIAAERAVSGAPIVTVMPGATYGPGDESMVGVLLKLYAKGLLVACPFQETGLSWVHVEDIANGMVLAFQNGEAPGTPGRIGINDSRTDSARNGSGAAASAADNNATSKQNFT